MYAGQEALDARRVVLAVPRVDWTWPPRQVNTVLRALFDGIELDPATFQPVQNGPRRFGREIVSGFASTMPEWRA